jgi:5-methylcytosine-specific restriction endonuclease McrA
LAWYDTRMRDCIYCQRTVEIGKRAVYCSAACRTRFNKLRRKGKVALNDRTCEGCGVVFRVFDARAMFCSQKCRTKHRPAERSVRACIVCSKEFTVIGERQNLTCGPECSGIRMEWVSYLSKKPTKSKSLKCVICLKEFESVRTAVYCGGACASIGQHWASHMKHSSDEMKALSAARARDYRARNAEAVRSRNRAYYQTDAGKTASKKAAYKYRAAAEKADGHHTWSEFRDKCRDLGWKCYWCGCELNTKTSTQDHVLPISKGGSNWITNIVPACKPCNSKKRDRIPQIVQKGIALCPPPAGPVASASP